MQKRKLRLNKIKPGMLVERKQRDQKHPTKVGMYLRKSMQKTPPTDDQTSFLDVLYRGKIVCWHISNLDVVDDKL